MRRNDYDDLIKMMKFQFHYKSYYAHDMVAYAQKLEKSNKNHHLSTV